MSTSRAFVGRPAAPVYGWRKPSSFSVPQLPPSPQTEAPDWSAQLDRARRFGHSLENLRSPGASKGSPGIPDAPLGPQSSAPIQCMKSMKKVFSTLLTKTPKQQSLLSNTFPYTSLLNLPYN